MLNHTVIIYLFSLFHRRRRLINVPFKKDKEKGTEKFVETEFKDTAGYSYNNEGASPPTLPARDLNSIKITEKDESSSSESGEWVMYAGGPRYPTF